VAERTAEADRGRHPGFPSFNVLAGGPGSLSLSFGSIARSFLRIDPRASYAQIHASMLECTEDELLFYLDSGVIKLVNAVAGVLPHRHLLDRVYDLICNKALKTALGRKVALFVLLCQGRRYPKSYDACLSSLDDRSQRVVEEALLGLCLWNRREALPMLDNVVAPGAKIDTSATAGTGVGTEAKKTPRRLVYMIYLDDPEAEYEVQPGILEEEITLL
jgi:hypothetical protein